MVSCVNVVYFARRTIGHGPCNPSSVPKIELVFVPARKGSALLRRKNATDYNGREREDRWHQEAGSVVLLYLAAVIRVKE
jgi:hypothetical protein